MNYSKWDYIDIPRATCPECGQECDVDTEDCSFDFEYGSIRGVHRDIVPISSCCEAQLNNADFI